MDPWSLKGAVAPWVAVLELEVAVAGTKWAMSLPRLDAGTRDLEATSGLYPALIWAGIAAAFRWA